MRRCRRQSRGLAEIVGTLMLVVIVVAAATAFSFFVAAYQKQVQSQEALQHEKSLEKLRILTLEPQIAAGTRNLSSLVVELASLDVNTIDVSGIVLSGYAVIAYTVVSSAVEGTKLATGCLSGDPYVPANTSCTLILPAESQTYLQFDFEPGTGFSFLHTDSVVITQSSVLNFQILTTLGNEFTQTFVPPVAIAGVTFVSGNPLLDGTNSYQPAQGQVGNVSIDLWEWNVTDPKDPSFCNETVSDCGNFSGQEVELPIPFASMDHYQIWLNVTNTESLVDSTEIVYTLAS